jgi:hypothetical protein
MEYAYLQVDRSGNVVLRPKTTPKAIPVTDPDAYILDDLDSGTNHVELYYTIVYFIGLST